MEDMDPVWDEGPLDGLERLLALDKASSVRGWTVDGTIGGASLMPHELENGWARVELYWQLGPEYHEVSVDLNPVLLIHEVKKSQKKKD